MQIDLQMSHASTKDAEHYAQVIGHILCVDRLLMYLKKPVETAFA